jgi:hypothetical protein
VAGAHALEPRGRYSWQVAAFRRGEEIRAPVPPAAEARFGVLASALPVLGDVRGEAVRSRALRGIASARMGLLDEAERELKAHLADHPGERGIDGLLRIVRSWRQ